MNSPNPSTQPAKPAFRMRSSLTPQPGAPLHGPNPQRRERYPSEPPPLTALIENPISVKPPSASQDYRHLNDVPSSLTLGSLVGAQKSVCILGSYSLSSLSLIGFISRTLPPIDLTLSLSFALRLLTVSARLYCLTSCFNLFQAFVPQTPQRLPCKSSRDTVLLSSLPTLDQPTSMSPFRGSSKRGRRLARLS